MKHFITAFITAVVVFTLSTLYYKGLPSFTHPNGASVVSMETEKNTDGLILEKPVDMGSQMLSAVRSHLASKYGEEFVKGTGLVITKVEGKCARGNAVKDEREIEWFAVKDGENWNLIWDGNGYVNCSNLSTHPDFSTDLIPQCWDDKLAKVITR
jgi:hypothetical protein